MPRRKKTNIWFGILSDLLVNISSGLFLVTATTIFSAEVIELKLLALSLNFSGGIFSLVIAYILRKKK